MIQLALHILDIVENSTRAGATLVVIEITEDLKKDLLRIEIEDNGHGMSGEMLGRALDPFFTTKDVRRIGLGLPMLRQAAEHSGGHFEIVSSPAQGTKVCAEFRHGHIDRQPMGDVAGVITALIAGNPDTDFIYRHRYDGKIAVIDTREIRREIENIPINHPEILKYIREKIIEGLEEIGTENE